MYLNIGFSCFFLETREDPSGIRSGSNQVGMRESIRSMSGPSTSFKVKLSESLKRLEATVLEIERNLNESRKTQSRPEDLFVMSHSELLLEKGVMQKQLLLLEKRHGRPETKEEKEIVRSLYDRYRVIKRISSRGTSVKENSLDLAPILEHETLELNPDEGSDSLGKGPSCTVVEVKRGPVVSPKSRRRRQGVASPDDPFDETCNNLRNEDFNEMDL